jgi:hypothetical protein
MAKDFVCIFANRLDKKLVCGKSISQVNNNSYAYIVCDGDKECRERCPYWSK